MSRFALRSLVRFSCCVMALSACAVASERELDASKPSSVTAGTGADAGVETGAHAQTCLDPTRTLHASGTSACRAYDGNALSCGTAWAVTSSTGQAVSCFYVTGSNTCQGCGPTNQAAGACVNSCAIASVSTPAMPPALLAALALALGGAFVVHARQARRAR